MTDKEVKDGEEITEQVVETLEYTDEDGVEHCFVVESKFLVGNETFAALLEVDPSIFDEEAQEECCEQHHVTEDEAEDDSEEEVNIILAKIIEDESGEIDIQVPTDAEFEKARLAYEALAEE